MEYDCHTMLYKIPNRNGKFLSVYPKRYEIYESNESKFYKKNNEYKNGKNRGLRLNNKNKIKLRILGEYFCRNNKNKGKLIINNKKSYLKEFIEIKNR